MPSFLETLDELFLDRKEPNKSISAQVVAEPGTTYDPPPRRIKVAIVTGASSGIGRTTAIALCEAGWDVVLSARRETELQETARLCKEARGGTLKGEITLVVPGDVTKEEDVSNLFICALKEYGALGDISSV